MKKFLIIMILFISVVLSACTVRKEIDKTIFTDCTLNQSVTIVNDETADILYKIFKEIKLDQEVDMYEGCLGTISFNFKDGTKDDVTIVDSNVISYQNKTYQINDRMLYITLVGALYNNEYRTILTLDDIKALVNEKGKELMYADFKDFVQLESGGSGVFIARYPIDNDFYLLLGTQNQNETPMYIRLMTYENRDNYIDIRTADIDKFISINCDLKK